MFKFIAVVLTVLLTFELSSQDSDPILFTVDNQTVGISEFDYIYNKNNNEEEKYTRSSLQEYLDLYINFKLKVRAAREMRLDTLTELQNELKGYQKQLADSYLTDKRIKNAILLEAYERSKKDIEIAHILAKTNPKSKIKDTTLNRITYIKELLDNGADFGEIAAQHSEDLRTKNKGGRIGFVNAILPHGFYNLETGVYNTDIGEVSAPIKTRLGYHLIKVLSHRDARGEIEASHILIKNDKTHPNPDSVRNLIQGVHKEILNGLQWEDAISKYSQDNLTNKKGGNLRIFGINKYDRSFEDAVFSLKNDGDISQPVQTRLGWHIIRRDSKREMLPFKQAKYAFDQKLKNSPRIKRAEKIVLEKMKMEADIHENEEALHLFVEAVDTNFYTFDWQGFSDIPSQELFSFDDKMTVTTKDFNNYLIKHKGSRVRSKRYKSSDKAINSLYQAFVDTKVLDYEKTKLPAKYPAFKSLMREYDEGILLFEITKRKIWDRALEDSLGLQAYFDKNNDKYQWKKRAEISMYDIHTDNVELAEKVKRFAIEHPVDDVLAKYGKENLIFHKTDKVVIDALPKGLQPELTASTDLTNKDDKTMGFMKLESFIPAGPKKLNEVKGYVLADYQQHLEKLWIDDLKKQYEVEIDQKVFESLVNK